MKNAQAFMFGAIFLLTGLTLGAIGQTGPGFTTPVIGVATLQASPSDPTGTTSAAGVMMGLGTTCTITPKYSTRVHLQILGNLQNDTASDGSGTILYYGTGTAPANAAATTGTRLGAANGLAATTVGTTKIPFNMSGLATNLTVGTAYWFDANVYRAVGGTASIKDNQCTAFEVL
jgi:hypothetical protein